MPNMTHAFHLFVFLGFATLCCASLDSCSLYAGGDFILSDNGEALSSGFIKYDIGTSSFQKAANALNDAHINSLYVSDE